MSPQLDARKRYLANSSATASPGQLVVMLYDGLVRDLAQAEQGMIDGEFHVSNERLIHAQQIVLELFASLERDAWEGGPGLAKIYLFLTTELVNANVTRDVNKVRACRALVEPLRDAWVDALATVNASVQPSAMGHVA
jgi:flagellar protein FliS